MRVQFCASFPSRGFALSEGRPTVWRAVTGTITWTNGRTTTSNTIAFRSGDLEIAILFGSALIPHRRIPTTALSTCDAFGSIMKVSEARARSHREGSLRVSLQPRLKIRAQIETFASSSLSNSASDLRGSSHETQVGISVQPVSPGGTFSGLFLRT